MTDRRKTIAETPPPLRFIYTNWRGERAEHVALPQHVAWGATEYHPDPQWIMTAFDVERGAQRQFAMKDMEVIK